MKRRGHLLIELLVVIAIIAIIAAIYYGGGFGTSRNDRPDKLGHSTVGKAALKARDTVCRDQLRQVRLSVDAQTSGDTPPASLSQLGLKDTMLKCPIGGEAYVYDATSQKVSCPHPGHENF